MFTYIIPDAITKTAPNQFNIEISAKYPAPFVWIEATGIKGRFSKNAFLMATEKDSVQFHSWQEGVDVNKLADALKVMTLFDINPDSTWLNNVTAQLVLAIVGVIFFIIATMQLAFIVMRSSKKRTSSALTLPVADNTIARKSSSGQYEDDAAQMVDPSENEATAFLIRSKRGYGHQAKQTEIRFYIV